MNVVHIYMDDPWSVIRDPYPFRLNEQEGVAMTTVLSDSTLKGKNSIHEEEIEVVIEGEEGEKQETATTAAAPAAAPAEVVSKVCR